MQLVTGQPVSAFRDATVSLGPWQFPLMVQDYIGSLNVGLAVPFLALGGVTVTALRWLSVMIGGLTLLLAWRVGRELGGPIAGIVAALLLVVSPSFVFWNRQGIFVTNITALIFMASLFAGLRWWRTRAAGWLWLTAFLWGLGVYAKLLFVWTIGAMAAVAALALIVEWVRAQRNHTDAVRGGVARPKTGPPTGAPAGAPTGATWGIALACFLIPLTPLILFNLRTGGTFASIFSNLGRSYYGVDNRAYLPNLATRLGQVGTLLRGDQFWYLGETFANSWAPWLAAGLIVLGLALGRGRGWVWLPLALLLCAVLQSAFTVSDLFVTHYALLLPLIPLAAGLAVAAVVARARESGVVARVLAGLALLSVVLWAGRDLWNTAQYHRVLAVSGGYATHSDAIYQLAGYLDEVGYRAPVALDWGLDAPLRFLTAGRVAPVEVFGYETLDVADAGFAARIAPYLEDNNNIYIAHVPEQTVFRGRVEALKELAERKGWWLLQQEWFGERSGDGVFVVYRAYPAE
jgi:hypothetical protein